MNKCSRNPQATFTATRTGKNWHYVILVEVTMITVVSPWDRKCDIYGSCTSQSKCYKSRSVTRESLNLMRNRMRFWTVTPEGLEIVSWQSTGSITLLAERTYLQTMVYETTRCPSSDRLIPCSIWLSRLSRKLHVTGHMLHNILDLLLTRNRATESLYANIFSASTYRIKGNAEMKLVTKKI